MRLNITPEQLQELSESGQAKLREWWKPATGDLFIDLRFFNVDKRMKEGGYWTEQSYLNAVCECDMGAYPTKRSLPLLSIGQMIEFIQKNEPSG